MLIQLLEENRRLKNRLYIAKICLLALATVVVVLVFSVARLADEVDKLSAPAAATAEIPAPDFDDVVIDVPTPCDPDQNDYREFIATAYCGCRECNEGWSDGVHAESATGAQLTPRCSIAADFDVLPPYTMVEISGMGIYTVHDCGGAIKGNRIDVYFDSHEEADAFGVRTVWLRVMEDDEL